MDSKKLTALKQNKESYINSKETLIPVLKKTIKKLIKKNDRDSFEYRIKKVIECPDNKFIPRVKNAGKIVKNYQIMHNGIKILRGSYYPELIERMLIENKGVHEPQEERVFLEVLKKLPKKATMLELGSYWAFYSIWFNKFVKKPTNYLVEPDKNFLECVKKNFKLNKVKGTFINGKIGKDYLTIDYLLKKFNLNKVDLLHSDIQGAEVEMLNGAKESIRSGKIDYIFISTHSQKLHLECLKFLKLWGFDLIFSADFDKETYSYDGIIVAKFNPNFVFKENKLEIKEVVKNNLRPVFRFYKTNIVKQFSQCGEDLIIDKIIGNKKNGFYIDIGANDPIKFNNTYKFYKKGWTGINIDPNPDSINLLNKLRVNDVNVKCGISNKNKKMKFYIFDDSMFSTFSKKQADVCIKQGKKLEKTIVVPVKKLSEVLDKIIGDKKIEIDFLSIDTEGLDLEVLKSNNWEKYRPRIICFEKSANTLKKAGLDSSRFLENLGYKKTAETLINNIYIKK